MKNIFILLRENGNAGHQDHVKLKVKKKGEHWLLKVRMSIQ